MGRDSKAGCFNDSTGEFQVSYKSPTAILFTPAHKPQMVIKANSSAASTVCLDLEDGVADTHKGEAREMLSESCAILKTGQKQVLVRINSEAEAWLPDLECLPHTCDCIVIPKTKGLAHVDAIAAHLDRRNLSTSIVALVEDPVALVGFSNDNAIPSPRLKALALGTEDLSMAIGCEPDSGIVQWYFNLLLSATHRLNLEMIGFAGSIANYKDLAALKSQTEKAAASGAVGAFCIHPNQVAVLNESYSPDENKIAWAGRVVGAYENAVSTGSAVATIDGTMVDKPVYLRARNILDKANGMRN